jgi:hypothetical protein
MAKKIASVIPAEKLSAYEAIVAALPGIERKGASMPYTSLNGHMFSFLDKEGQLALRLDTEERDAFLKKYKTTLCHAHGTVLKEYVVVPDALVKKPAELKPYFAASLTYIRTLKPKPSKRSS